MISAGGPDPLEVKDFKWTYIELPSLRYYTIF